MQCSLIPFSPKQQDRNDGLGIISWTRVLSRCSLCKILHNPYPHFHLCLKEHISDGNQCSVLCCFLYVWVIVWLFDVPFSLLTLHPSLPYHSQYFKETAAFKAVVSDNISFNEIFFYLRRNINGAGHRCCTWKL